MIYYERETPEENLSRSEVHIEGPFAHFLLSPLVLLNTIEVHHRKEERKDAGIVLEKRREGVKCEYIGGRWFLPGGGGFMI